jgi:hypothetical protein
MSLEKRLADVWGGILGLQHRVSEKQRQVADEVWWRGLGVG